MCHWNGSMCHFCTPGNSMFNIPNESEWVFGMYWMKGRSRTAERARNYYLQYDSAKLIALPALLYGVRPFLESFSEFAHNKVSSKFELQVALVEFHTKWICIMRGPGVLTYCFLKLLSALLIIHINFWWLQWSNLYLILELRPFGFLLVFWHTAWKKFMFIQCNQ